MEFPRELRVGIVNNMGIFEVDSDNTGLVNITGGLESKFLDILAEGLKFSYKAFIPADRHWGKPSNNTWTGIVGMVIRNEVDIGLSKIGITADKTLFVDFSYPYAVEDLTFATRKPGFLSKETAISYPFSRGVWISLFISMLLACVAFHLLLSKRHGFSRKVMFVFASVLNMSVEMRTDKTKERFLIVFWVFGAMIVSYSYTALLLSFLTLPVKERPISSKQELSDAIDGGAYTCVMSKGSHLFTSLSTSNDRYLVNIANKIAENDWFIEPSDEAVVHALGLPKTAVIGPKNDFKLVLEDTIYISREVIRPMYWGIAVRKQFCCKGALDTVIHRVLAAGLYAKEESDYFYRMQLRNSFYVSGDEERIKMLTVSDISGAAFFLVSGYILSFFALVAEIAVKKRDKKRTKKSLHVLKLKH